MTDVAGWDYATPSDVEPPDTAKTFEEMSDDELADLIADWNDGEEAITRATDIAGRAADLVGGDRDRQHGQKADNFNRIATMWNAWLSIRREPDAPLTGHDVGQMMSLMKKARTQSGDLNIDDYVDDCGYAACAGEIAANG